MTNVQFTITGERELMRRLDALGKFPGDLMRETGLTAVREAKTLVPRRTGNLGRTIRIGTISDSHVEVRAGGTREVGYAAAVEFGTRPHVILPRNRRALAWGGARTLGGRLRSGARATNFATRVNHPGTRPKPYLIPGFEKALKLVGLDGLIRRWNEAA